MNRISFKFGLVGAMVLASVASILLIERQTPSRWREQQELLLDQSGRMAELAAEHQSLAALVAQETNSVLSSDEFKELLKLRGEIGPMRQSARELPALQLTHRELLAAIKNRQQPQDQAVLAYWPKGQLTPAGYAEPEAALQTALCAMSRNDSTALLASVTPQAASTLTNGRFGGDNTADKISAATRMASDSLGPASGFYLVGQELNSPDQATLDVYFESESATRQFVLRQIGSEWKLDGLYPPNLDVYRGPKLWP
jgi:hypothetical protein